MTDDRHEDVAFQPTRIGRRRRGPDPVIVGLVVVIGGLLLAVIKPWAGPVASASPSASAVASTSVSNEATPNPQATPDGPPDAAELFDDPLATVTILDALEPHDDWGLRVVERAPDFRTGYRERWAAAPSAGGTRSVSMPVGEPTLAVGITSPPNETPLDVRVFESDGDTWSWLDVPRVTTDRPVGSLLLRPPRVQGADQAAWPAGTYRIELLMGTSIETIDLTLPYPISRVDPPASHGGPPDDVFVGGVPIGSIRERGAFLMNGGVVVPLDGVASQPLDPAHAWLASANEDGVGAVPSIATTFALELGVMLPARADGIDATLSRLTPPGPFEPPAPEVVTGGAGANLPYVVFEAADGPGWPAGTYGMRVRWRDDDGRHDQTWHVTLLPGEPDPEPAMLRSARLFEGFAGQDGIAIGPSFSRSAGPGVYFVSYLPFERTTDGGDAQAVACGSTFISGKPEVVGISHPIAAPATSVTMDLLVPGGGGETREVPLRTAELDGLTLIEPARGASFAQGVYQLTFDDAVGGHTTAMICLGTSPFEG